MTKDHYYLGKRFPQQRDAHTAAHLTRIGERTLELAVLGARIGACGEQQLCHLCVPETRRICSPRTAQASLSVARKSGVSKSRWRSVKKTKKSGPASGKLA